MKELHLNKKDFKIDWFSGTGAGGQHRNKHQNCCRITHKESGLTSIGTSHKSREMNKKEAFEELANKIIERWKTYLNELEGSIKENEEVIRNYNKLRDEVHDYVSGLKQSYQKVVEKNDISDMIESRNEKCKLKENL